MKMGKYIRSDQYKKEYRNKFCLSFFITTLILAITFINKTFFFIEISNVSSDKIFEPAVMGRMSHGIILAKIFKNGDFFGPRSHIP